MRGGCGGYMHEPLRAAASAIGTRACQSQRKVAAAMLTMLHVCASLRSVNELTGDSFWSAHDAQIAITAVLGALRRCGVVMGFSTSNYNLYTYPAVSTIVQLYTYTFQLWTEVVLSTPVPTVRETTRRRRGRAVERGYSKFLSSPPSLPMEHGGMDDGTSATDSASPEVWKKNFFPRVLVRSNKRLRAS